MNCLESHTFPSYLSRRWVQIWVAWQCNEMRSDACCDERARWYSDSVVFSFLTCHDCTRIIHNGSQCVLLIVSHWFWLFLCFWYYFWPSIFIAFQLQAWSAWSEVSCQMRQGCRIHHWPGRPQFQLPVLIRSKHVVPCLNTNMGHLKFSLVLHNFCAIYGKSFCGNADCNSFELPTQSFVRSWFPTWRTSLHNFACNALCAWALGLEDCTWQQIHNDNAQNTNCQRHRCLDCMIHSLQGHCLVIFHVVSLFQRNRVPRFALSSWAREMCFLGGFSIEFALKLLAPLYGGVLFVVMFLGYVMNPRESCVAQSSAEWS